MNTYLTSLQIGMDQASIGSSLYGICTSLGSNNPKIVALDAFDGPEHGVTINVKFNRGNTVSSGVKLTVGTGGTYDVIGSCLCGANDILTFTFDQTDNGQITDDQTKWCWRVTGLAISPGTATPSAIGSAAVGTSSKYAHEDHVHSIDLATGDNNGQVKIAGQNVNVRGLGDAAYTSSAYYATAAQGAKADTAAQLEGAIFTGPVILSGAPVENLEAATKKYVDDSLSSLEDVMILKGTIGQRGTITNLPTSQYITGWTYKVITAGTYAGQHCEVNDLIVAISNGPATGSSVISGDWTVIQGNLDGVVTGPDSAEAAHVATFTDATGKSISDSGFTIAASVPANAQFTDNDTTYTLTDGQAYTGHTVVSTLAQNDDGEILAYVSRGVLHLLPGIKFTTGNVGAELNPVTN